MGDGSTRRQFWPRSELSAHFSHRSVQSTLSVLHARRRPWVPRKQILIFKEIVRFGRVMTQLSVTKVRLTGGEPLVRRSLPDLIERWTRNMSRIEG